MKHETSKELKNIRRRIKEQAEKVKKEMADKATAGGVNI
jgi:hypothetical protein